MMSSGNWLTSLTLLLLLYLGDRQLALALGRQGDGTVNQADVIRFVLAMQSKAGPTAMDRARLRHYQQMPALTFDDGRQPNDINNDEDVDKTLYGVGF